jgi:hypothetical protein
MDTEKPKTVADAVFVNPNEGYDGSDLTAVDLHDSTYDLFELIAEKLGVRLNDGADSWRVLALEIADKTTILSRRPCSYVHGHRCIHCGEPFK